MQEILNLNMEPKLPDRVKHLMGLYVKDRSDLFIDDLSPAELRMIANHQEWYIKNVEYSRNKDK